MKKIHVLTAGFGLTLAMAAAGCGMKNTETPANTETETEIVLPAETESAAAQNGSGEGAEGFTVVYSEKEKNQELEKLVAEEYMIPEEELEETRYYYNYVDFNGDGKDEIFALLVGSYTSGSGGSSAVIVEDNGGELIILQDFTLINPPVYVSDTTTEGRKNLIVPSPEGSGYVKLTWKEGAYTTVNDGEEIADLSGETGVQIISDDLAADLDSGDYMTLGK